MSKNKPTIRQLELLCRHIIELEQAAMTENHAIRTLELVADIYAKTHKGGKASVHKAKDVPENQWSLAALEARRNNPSVADGTFLRVEHGTPRRTFARKVRELHAKGALNEEAMKALADNYWHLAVLTHAEDRLLRRKDTHESPQERWAAVGIKFSDQSPNAPIS
jgi:hypothetical protein